MHVAHQHNLTDDEFIRMHQHTSDPLLAEALRRLDNAPCHSSEAKEAVDEALANVSSAFTTLSNLSADME